MFHAIFEGVIFTSVCLGLIALSLVAMVTIMIVLFFQTRKSIRVLQDDFHRLSSDTARVLETLDEFVRTDLHEASKETTQLISSLSELSANVSDKVDSFNFLSKPLHFLSNTLGFNSSSDGSDTQSPTLPQTIKWVGSGVSLIKTIEGF